MICPSPKTQAIRLADVFLIGPVMIWGGIELARLRKPVLGLTLGLLGAATAGYNLRNYLALRT